LPDPFAQISVEELKALGERLFPHLDHPWREKFFAFLTDNPGATFHHATTHDRVQIVLLPRQGEGHMVPAGKRHGTDAAEGVGDFEADRRRALSRALHHGKAMPTKRKPKKRI
jgi:hypothetical protein